jgi:hypothetical protein
MVVKKGEEKIFKRWEVVKIFLEHVCGLNQISTVREGEGDTKRSILCDWREISVPWI